MKRIFILMAMFAITVGATAQLKVLSNGNTGIGTSNPVEKFQIGDIWTFHNGGTKYIGRNVTYNTSANSARNERIQNGSTSLLSFGDGTISLETAGYGLAGTQVSATGRLVLTADGSVGIGTSTPNSTQKLHVNGPSFLNGNVSLGVINNVDPTIKLWVEGHVRFSAWTDIIFDWSGKCCGSPVMYPETNWYLQLGKADRKLGTVYTDMVYCSHYESFSDERSKENIKKLDKSLIEKILRVSGYNYNFKRDMYPEDLPEDEILVRTKTKIGFLAQELEKEFPELVNVPTSKDELYSIDYQGMIPVLVEAIKEQQFQIENLQAQVNACCQGTPPAYSPPRDPEEGNGKENPEKSTYINNVQDAEKAKLFQNIPNPFSTNTEIRFEIPQNVSSAKLLVHDMQGAEIKSYNVTTRGAGNIIIQAQELPAGMYMYTLLVNNAIIDTKKMILTK